MKQPRRVKIAGIGKYLPARRVSSTELEGRLGLSPGWIERKTGVRERRYAETEVQSQMGAHAARAALDDSGVSLKDIDLIISASATPEQCIPCTAVFIQRALGAEAEGVPCFDVDSTCLSFVFGLEVAASFVASGSYRNVLVVSAELPSVALDWKEPESSVLMGDGAAAVVVTRAAETDESVLYPAGFTTFSSGAELAQLQGGGSRFHPDNPATRPELNRFHMKGPKIFRFAQKAAVPFVARYLEEIEWPSASLDVVVPHQASLFAVRMSAKACGFAPEKLVENIQTHGNCLAASIPMALHDGIRSGQIRRGHRVFLVGTAAGLSVGALALRF
jgi:3-oxoacyl-[acyl-carrier-protein] synthase-3